MAAAGGRARKDLLPLLVVPLFLLGPVAFSGRVFLPQLPVQHEPYRSEHPEAARRADVGANQVLSDRLYPFLTDQIAARRALFDGEWPLWEPDQALGVPLFAESAAGLAYPPNWLAFLVPPERAAAPLAMLSLFLAGLGAWLFLGGRGLSRPARLTGAVAYQLGGFGLANLFYYMKVDAALWLPWALWSVDGLARGRRWSGLCLTLATAASLLSGFVQVGLFVAAATALYALVRLTVLGRWLDPEVGVDGAEPDAEQKGSALADEAEPRPASLAFVGLFLLLGGVASAVVLLPARELSLHSDRQLGASEVLAADSLPVGTALGTVLGDFVGDPAAATPAGGLPVAWWITPASAPHKAEGANALEWNTYAGAVCCVLALVGLVAAPRRTRFPALLLLLVFGFAQGWPGVRALYHVPGLNVGAVGRVLALAWFLWPWLAAHGVEAWLERRPRAFPALFGGAFLLTALAFSAWSGLEPEAWAERLEAGIVERYADTHAPTLDEVRARLPRELSVAAGERLRTSLALAFGSGLALLLAALAGLVFGKPRESFSTGPPTLGLVVVLAVLCVVGVATSAERALDETRGLPLGIAAVGALAALALLVWRRKRGHRLARWLPLLAVLLIEGFVAAQGHVAGRILEGELFPESQALAAVEEAAGDGRVLRLDTSESGLGDVLALARPNVLQPLGVADLTPWVVFHPRTRNELFWGFDPGSRFLSGVARLSDPGLLGHPVLDLVRATAILSRGPLEDERLEPVLERPGFHVYRRTGALPPARVVGEAVPATTGDAAVRALASGLIDLEGQTVLFAGAFDGAAVANPSRVLSLERPARGRVEIEVGEGDGGWLVLHEQHFPGWRVSVNGEPAELLRADHVYQGVALPPGAARVVFRYAPGSVQLGAALTLLALGLAVFLSRKLSA